MKRPDEGILMPCTSWRLHSGQRIMPSPELNGFLNSAGKAFTNSFFLSYDCPVRGCPRTFYQWDALSCHGRGGGA